jgi:hypothetical protein
MKYIKYIFGHTRSAIQKNPIVIMIVLNMVRFPVDQEVPGLFFGCAVLFCSGELFHGMHGRDVSLLFFHVLLGYFEVDLVLW